MVSPRELSQIKQKLEGQAFEAGDLDAYLKIFADYFNNHPEGQEYIKHFRVFISFTVKNGEDFWLKFYKGDCDFGFGEAQDNLFQKIFKYYVEIPVKALIQLILGENKDEIAKKESIACYFESEKLRRVLNTFQMVSRYISTV